MSTKECKIITSNVQYVTEKGQERQDSFSYRKSYRKPRSTPVPIVPEDDYVDGGVFQKSTARLIGGD